MPFGVSAVAHVLLLAWALPRLNTREIDAAKEAHAAQAEDEPADDPTGG